MAISTDEYARLAADSYFDRVDGTPVSGTSFTVYKTLKNTTSGYYGVIEQQRGQVHFASRIK